MTPVGLIEEFGDPLRVLQNVAVAVGGWHVAHGYVSWSGAPAASSKGQMKSSSGRSDALASTDDRPATGASPTSSPMSSFSFSSVSTPLHFRMTLPSAAMKNVVGMPRISKPRTTPSSSVVPAGKVTPDFVEERLALLIRAEELLRADVDAEDRDLVAALVVDVLELGQLGAAGRAERGPEVQHDGLALADDRRERGGVAPEDVLSLVGADLDVRNLQRDGAGSAGRGGFVAAAACGERQQRGRRGDGEEGAFR